MTRKQRALEASIALVGRDKVLHYVKLNERRLRCTVCGLPVHDAIYCVFIATYELSNLIRCKDLM